MIEKMLRIREMTDVLVEDNPILKHCVSVVFDPNMKLSSFDNETAIIVYERLHNVYTQYIGKEIDNTSFAKNDSPKDYFQKHYTEKSKNNPLKEYLTTPEENYHLIVQATSVSSEQMFSIAKNTINPLHNQLSEENICA
ncbi:20875_t:CDS:2, partial [Cetraspora pellucida]